MTIQFKSIKDGQKHANAIRNEQGRIRRPLVAQVRREIAAGEYWTNEDDAIDRLIDSGDLDDRMEHAERWDGMS